MYLNDLRSCFDRAIQHSDLGSDGAIQLSEFLLNYVAKADNGGIGVVWMGIDLIWYLCTNKIDC